ncbi:hypothetical protein HN51_070378, partial [Arachis hypogaea]
SSIPSIPRPTISKRKNATRNRSDIGWKHGIDVQGNGKKVKYNYCSKTISEGIYRFKHHLAGTKEDSEPCALVLEEVKAVMLKICVEAKEVSLKKRRFGEDEHYPKHTEKESEKDNSQQKGKDMRNFVTKGNGAIPFNVIKNPEFLKFCEIVGRYGIGYKLHSYHELRETQLKKVVTNVDEMLTDFKAEWKRTGSSIMSNGWIDKKRRSICNLVNSPKGILKVHEITTKKEKKNHHFIYSKSMLISMLRNFTKGKDLIRSGATRFATAYLTLTCLHDNKGPLMTMFTSDVWKTTK